MAAAGDVLLPSRANMDDDSYDLVMKLMLEDSRQLAEGKGKQKEGSLSDTELAFGLYAQEIQNALTIDADHRLVVSMQQALRTDANAVTRLQQEEYMAQHDHEVAVALSEGRDPPPMPPAPIPAIVPEVSSVLKQTRKRTALETDGTQLAKRSKTVTWDLDPAKQSAKGKEPVVAPAQPAKRPRTEVFDFRDETDDLLIFHGKQARLGESSSWATSRQPPPDHRLCTSCMESTPESRLIRAPCQHEYCHDCIKSLFTTAMRDESLFPPKCCQQALPAEQHSKILGSNLINLYRAKQIEFSTENRTYCHNAECGAFIKPSDVGRCTSCGMRTCVSCKKIAHGGDCPKDAELRRVLEMAEQEGWRRCTKCNAMVELAYGCNHMTCRCSYQFCYTCGLEWKEPKDCPCPLWNEENLIVRNNLVEQRRGVVDQERHHVIVLEDFEEPLDADQECNHRGDWRRVRGDGLQCDNCSYSLPYYLYECTRCQLQVCRQCRFHRL